ncbi:unnamed protein product [Rotaria sp. Silwood2]|nr:unnamed protein product [Rotaria sp. Silwood2]
MMFKTLSILLIIYLIDCVVAQSKSETVLFISIPFIGHLNPLLNQAIELYQRRDIDYNIYIISCSNVKTYVETRCWNTTIKFVDIGQCQNDTEIASNFKNIAAQTTIVDRLIYAGTDIAHYFIIPCLINAANLLPYLGWYDILLADYNPTILLDSSQTIYSIGTNLLLRTISPIIRYLSVVYIYFRYDRPLDYLRQKKFHFNNSFHLWSHYHSYMVLVKNAFGVEYAQYVPPNVLIVI